MKNYMLTLQYDGTRYNGWQRQGNTKNTIQEKVETLLETIAGHAVEVNASGRTDAGVHALRQTLTVKLDTPLTPDELVARCNRYLPKDIGVTEGKIVPDRFHARLSAKRKTYRYTVRTAETPDVFTRHYHWHLGKPLDFAAMEEAARYLEGEHDFTAFCSLKKMKRSALRKIYSIDMEQTADSVRLSFCGSGFLYNMVRIMAGTLVEVGLGKRNPESVKAALDSRDRAFAGETAPAEGLCLIDVEY